MGHAQEECLFWAACVRDIGMANNAAMMAAYKRPDASSSPRPPLPPTTSVEATAPPPLCLICEPFRSIGLALNSVEKIYANL